MKSARTPMASLCTKGNLPTGRSKGRDGLHFHVALLTSDYLVSLGSFGGFTPLLLPSLAGLCLRLGKRVNFDVKGRNTRDKEFNGRD